MYSFWPVSELSQNNLITFRYMLSSTTLEWTTLRTNRRFLLHKYLSNLRRILTLVSWGNDDILQCFWYQCSVWMVIILIYCHIFTAPFSCWLKVKYKIKVLTMIIWGCKVYAVFSKSRNKSLYNITYTDICVTLDQWQST